MANTIRLRRGSGAPSAGSFVEGEPAWDGVGKKLYVKAADGTMAQIGGSGTYTFSSAAPSTPSAGDRWTDADDGITYEYVNDGDSSQWVELGPTGQRGSVGPKSVTLANPTNSEKLLLFFTDAPLTLAQIRSVLIGSSGPSVTFSLRYGTDVSASGTEVVTGGITCTSTTSGVGTTSFNSGAIPASNFVWLTTSAVSGNVSALHITITFV